MSNGVDYHISQSMRQYLLPVMMLKFGDKCAVCGDWYPSYEIDHKRYAPDITMYDLQLLCIDCHHNKTTLSNEAHITKTTHCATCMCY